MRSSKILKGFLLGCFCFSGLSPVVISPLKADIFDTAITSVANGFDYLWPDDVSLEDFSFRVGYGLGLTPDYEGSDDFRFLNVPLMEINFRNKLVLQGTKIRYNLLTHELFRAGPLINYKFGREEKRNSALTGMGDEKDALEAGMFFDGRYKGFIYSGDIRHGMGSGLGISGRFIFGHGIYQDEKFMAVAALQMKWGGDATNRELFGVTAEQSISTGIAAFDPDGGLSSAGLNFYGRYQVGENMRLEGLIGLTRITGKAADSPLVRDFGSRNQFMMGFGARISF